MNDLYRSVPILNTTDADLMKWVFDSFYLTLIVDERGIIRYVSNSYAAMLGWTADQMLNRPIKQFLPTTQTNQYLLSGERKTNVLFELPDGRTVICNYIPVRDIFGTVKAVLVTSMLNDQEIVENLYSEVKELKKSNELYEKELRGLHKANFAVDNFVGSTPEILALKHQIERVANTRIPVLITGENGCGKEVFANAIHEISDRKNHPFVKINCAAIPKDLMESELFGYEAGTFSGANRQGKAGKFELANNGTILLDEIGELPFSMQAKLLRVLQEYEVERIGSVHSIPLNVRIICCTNQDLPELIQEGKFRQDLFYRINVMHLQIPPLRERKSDIPALCKVFIKTINQTYKLQIQGIAQEATEAFLRYDWPGNVRELQHTLERAAIMADRSVLDLGDFAFFFGQPRRTARGGRSAPLSDAVGQSERDCILQALLKTGGKKSKAAQLLGISRSQLYAKLKKYSIGDDFCQDARQTLPTLP